MMTALLTALIAASLTGAPASAARTPDVPHISSSTPYQIMAGGSPHAEDLEIDGSGLIPPGSTFQTVPVDVRVFANDGTGWRQGSVTIPGNHGWGVGHLSIRTPAVVPTTAGLQIKLVVKGVDSNVYTVPVFTPLPPGKPVITAVKPSFTVLGSTDYYFVLQVFTNGQGGRLYFNGTQLKDYVGDLKGPTELFYQFIVPKEYRDKIGVYPIQVKNDSGASPIATWELVAPPVLSSLSPAHLTNVQVAPGAKPISVTARFGPSPPKTVWYTADAGTNWIKADPVIIFGNQATFEIKVAALQAKSRIAVKIVNEAGDATRVMLIKTLPSAAAKPEKTVSPLIIKK